MALTVSNKSALSGAYSSWVKQPAISSLDSGLTPWTITLPLTKAVTGVQTAIVLPTGFDGRLVAISAYVSLLGVGTDASVVIQPENGSTPVTGGEITATEASTDALGEVQTVSAITAANTFTAGDTLNILFTVGTAFSAGALSYTMWFSGTSGSAVIQALRETRFITDSDD